MATTRNECSHTDLIARDTVNKWLSTRLNAKVLFTVAICEYLPVDRTYSQTKLFRVYGRQFWNILGILPRIIRPNLFADVDQVFTKLAERRDSEISRHYPLQERSFAARR